MNTIKKFPKSWIAYDGYGYFLFRNGDYSEAIVNYKKILDITPENISALNNIAAMHLLKNEFDHAAFYLEKASRIEPDSAVFAIIGSMYYLSKKFSKAAFMYEKSLYLEPENYQWMVYLADAYKFIPEKEFLADLYFRDAIKFANKDIEDNPKIAKSYRYLALAKTYFGSFSEANEILEKADILDAKSIEALSCHLRVAIAQKDEKRIRRYVKKLLQSQYSDKLLLANPDFAVLKESRFGDLFDRIH